MPYGQNPQIQQTLEDISRGRYRSRKKGGGTVAGTVLANRFAKQQDEDITSVRQFNQSLDQARALEGMASPTPTRSKINLGIGRSLEGMRQEGSVGLGPDAMGKRNLSDVMERFGDPQFGAVFRQPELRLQGEGGKEMVEFARDDPRLFAELWALSTIQAGSKVGASTSRALGGDTRGDEPLNLLSAINELSSRITGQQPIRQGTIEFMRPEFRKEPTAGERVEVGSYFIPGFGPLGGITRGVAKGAKATQRLGGVSRRFASSARSEGQRLETLVNAPFEQQFMDQELARIEKSLGISKTEDINPEDILPENIERQITLGWDAQLLDADIKPDSPLGKDVVALRAVDPTSGKWDLDMKDMSRDEIEVSLRRTLQGGRRRQIDAGIEPDELPDFNSQEWQDAVDQFIAKANPGNLVRSRTGQGKPLNWLSLANDHYKALKNKDNPGRNTIENLTDSYGRLNSAWGAQTK